MSKRSKAKEIRRKIRREKKSEERKENIQPQWMRRGEIIDISHWRERRIEKSSISSGDTLEKIAASLCERISIQDLVFVSPKYIDGKGIEKELCDILVLHKNCLLVFQVKHRSISPDATPEVIFGRASKTIHHSVSQFDAFVTNFLSKANIKANNLRDNKCNIMLSDFAQVHLISLVCFPGKANFPENSNFDIHNPYQEFKSFPTHIFEIDDFSKVTLEFDTTQDLSEYLSIRRKFYSKNCIGISKELDLIAAIKMNWEQFFSDFEKRSEFISLEDGIWDEYVKRFSKPIVKRAKLNKYSYIYDYLLSSSWRAIGYEVPLPDNFPVEINQSRSPIDRHMQLLLEFNSFKRIHRRDIVDGIFSTIKRARENERKINTPFAFRLIQEVGCNTSFLILAINSKVHSRKERLAFLHNLCMTASYKFRIKNVVGIATESEETTFRTEDYFGCCEIGFDYSRIDNFSNLSDSIWSGHPQPKMAYEFV
jgi:hypothetical protein